MSKLPSIGVKFKYFLLLMAVVALILGCWLTFFHSKGFVKTTGTIVAVVEEEGVTSDDTEYTVTVAYDVDGVHYESLLDSYSPSYKPGKEVKIMYDPDNPGVVHGDDWMGLYCIGFGLVCIIGSFMADRKTKRDLKRIRDTFGESGYAQSKKGDKRQLYFITDRGTPKYGHRIEDAEHRVLYEAKVTKFNLLTPIEFDFIDHEHRYTTHHLIGHEEETLWDTFLIDNNYTFTIDGEDIWQHLKSNGIKVNSGFASVTKVLHRNYRIFRDDEEIAFVENTSIYPHEDDAEAHGKLGKLVPVTGYYRITTREEYLDLIFITIMAFARTGAFAANGGIYGGLRVEEKDQE